ncbi:hypothetical protein [Candidatus Viridilinea mediisalina]|uniref:hypothetical protein n=1 Tax=Candidatus Viridilinea mediisalina TaxID=2024553 RepID=UPI000F5A6035|nr:hypothetical protein [Candidatus Viridilinea mediisalina]
MIWVGASDPDHLDTGGGGVSDDADMCYDVRASALTPPLRSSPTGASGGGTPFWLIVPLLRAVQPACCAIAGKSIIRNDCGAVVTCAAKITVLPHTTSQAAWACGVSCVLGAVGTRIGAELGLRQSHPAHKSAWTATAELSLLIFLHWVCAEYSTTALF